MQKKEHALCFTGHRSERLPEDEEQLEKLKQQLWEEIDKAIEAGVDTFYFGGCYGWDLMCAEIVLKRRKIIRMDKPEQIRLVGVLPWEEQAIIGKFTTIRWHSAMK